MTNNARITATALRGHPDLMTVKDVQNVLHIGRSKAYTLLKCGELRYLKIGGVYRVPKAFLIDYLNDKT